MSIPRDKIDHLILDYFIREGYQEAAVSLSKELNIDLGTTSSFLTRGNAFVNKFAGREVGENEFAEMVDSYFNEKLANQVQCQGENRTQDSENEIPLSRADSSESAEGCGARYGAGSSTDRKSRDSPADITGAVVGPSYSATHLVNNSSINSKLISGYSTIYQRKEIKLLILKGSITQAIRKISENFPTVLDSNNLLHFKLLRLNLIEMIRDHKLNVNLHTMDGERQFLANILTFVRENLINKVSNSFKLLKELEITMSLLCFNFDPTVKNIEDQKDLPEQLRSLFNLSLRNQCYRLVNKAILNLYDKDDVIDSGGDDNENDNLSIFRGPKYVEYDLCNLDEFLGDSKNDVLRKDIGYSISDDKSSSQLVSDESDENLVQEESIEEEMNKLRSLSLESKLERVIKLWTITEQRLLDLNITKEKRYVLSEESL